MLISDEEKRIQDALKLIFAASPKDVYSMIEKTFASYAESYMRFLDSLVVKWNEDHNVEGELNLRKHDRNIIKGR